MTLADLIDLYANATPEAKPQLKARLAAALVPLCRKPFDETPKGAVYRGRHWTTYLTLGEVYDSPIGGWDWRGKIPRAEDVEVEE